MRHACILSALLLAGCKSAPPPAVQAMAPPEQASPERTAADTVQLDPATQAKSGIVVESVQERSEPELLSISGRIVASEDRSWRVGSVVEGRIVRTLVGVGDRVKPGQLLALVHSHEVHDSRAEYQKSAAELGRAKATLAEAERVRDRMRNLLAAKAAAVEQVEHAETALRAAQAAVASAETERQRVRTHLEEYLGIPAEDVNHAGDKHDDEADYVPIRAPAGGVVLHRDVTAGSVVQIGAPLFTLTDLSSVWLIAAAPETTLSRLRVGQSARVRVQAYPEVSFAGRVAQVGYELDPTTRTVPVRLLLPNPGEKLRPEMFGTAEFRLSQSRQALSIPDAAVQQVHAQPAVFVRDGNGTFRVRPVELGPCVQGRCEVKNGLRPGEWVVSQGAFLLKSQLLKSSLEE